MRLQCSRTIFSYCKIPRKVVKIFKLSNQLITLKTFKSKVGTNANRIYVLKVNKKKYLNWEQHQYYLIAF